SETHGGWSLKGSSPGRNNVNRNSQPRVGSAELHSDRSTGPRKRCDSQTTGLALHWRADPRPLPADFVSLAKSPFPVAASTHLPVLSSTPFAMPSYDARRIEARWQTYWDEHGTFVTSNAPREGATGKLYVLDMFPYPSGDGLHVGHPEGYT